MKKQRLASKISGWHEFGKCIISWKQQTQMHGALPVLYLHAAVFAATKEQQIGLSGIGVL